MGAAAAPRIPKGVEPGLTRVRRKPADRPIEVMGRDESIVALADARHELKTMALVNEAFRASTAMVSHE